MSVYSSGMHHRSFVWQISSLLFILGIILAAAAVTSQHIARGGVNFSRPGFNFGADEKTTADKAEKVELEIKKLRETNKKLEDLLSKGNDASKMLNSELQEEKRVSGLTELAGPGIIVTLQDSKKMPPLGNELQYNLIHQQDILEVINELKSAGAEAISINGQRVVYSTAVRCVGPVAQINDSKKTSPFVITAIGDSETLLGAMNLANGVLDNIRRYDPYMAGVEKQATVKVPAFSGSIQMKYAQTPKK